MSCWAICWPDAGNALMSALAPIYKYSCLSFTWDFTGRLLVIVLLAFKCGNQPVQVKHGMLVRASRNEPNLVSDGSRKAVVLAAIHWWSCWKMMYSVSKSVMVFGRCQSLVSLSPCFLSGTHFVVMWGHMTRKNGFYFSGRVLQFGITLSFSQSSSPLLFLSRQMPDLFVSYCSEEKPE